MPIKPMCQPDGPKIHELIKTRGYHVVGFARYIGRPKSVRSIWRAIAGYPTAIDLIRPVARGLRVKPGEISDWTGDDDIWDELATKVA
jgi:hypothetical protein